MSFAELAGGTLVVGAFAASLIAETARPLRARAVRRRWRLSVNAAVAALAFLTVRGVVVPITLWTAGWAESAGFGLLRWSGLPPALQWPVGLLLFDYSIWLWHRLNHRVPGLWRFHRVHHTDLDLDTSTALRFHAGELVLSSATRAIQVAVIGLAAPAALMFEAVTTAATAFHHSNVRLPLGVERALVRAVVTPRMHGIHHSIVERETNANWSVIFSWWDRAHGTLRLDVPQRALTIGVPAYRDRRELGLVGLLTMPFGPQRPTWRAADGHRPDRPPAGDPWRLVA